MTREKQDIKEDFYSGDTKDLVFEIFDKDGALYPLSNAEATYALFTNDGHIVLMKSSDQSGAITIDDVNSLATVHLLPPDTIQIHGSYRHQLHIKDANNYLEIVSTGKVNIKQSFARMFRLDAVSAFLLGG